MSLLVTIEEDFGQALKTKDQAGKSTLRLLKAELTKKAKAGREVTEADVLQVIKSQIKQRQDSIAEYDRAARQDLADQERRELEILQRYLPPAPSAEEVSVAIDTILAGLAEPERANFGKVMAGVMQQLGGAADGGLVSQLVKQKLQSSE
ncbi:GatB/YqeY domain-containing protein [Candidatus Falkowbacteria bacterium]|nr:GatB/YqeY domain-containing protein [Candidatus Falkowbacteria bacterium]